MLKSPLGPRPVLRSSIRRIDAVSIQKKVKKVKKNEKPNKIRHLRRSVYDVGPDASLPNVLTGSHGLVTVPTLGGVITEHFNTV
jgi:hypothetical protein